MPKTGIPVHIEPKTGTYENEVKNARRERRFWPIGKIKTLDFFLRLNSSSNFAASTILMGNSVEFLYGLHISYICGCFDCFVITLTMQYYCCISG